MSSVADMLDGGGHIGCTCGTRAAAVINIDSIHAAVSTFYETQLFLRWLEAWKCSEVPICVVGWIYPSFEDPVPEVIWISRFHFLSAFTRRVNSCSQRGRGSLTRRVGAALVLGIAQGSQETPAPPVVIFSMPPACSTHQIVFPQAHHIRCQLDFPSLAHSMSFASSPVKNCDIESGSNVLLALM